VQKIDFEGFCRWVQEGKGTRTVEIRIGKSGNKDFLSIWAYDYEMSTGQFVERPEDINLGEKLREKIEDLLDQARKFGVTAGVER